MKKSIAAGLAGVVIALTAAPGAARATETTPCAMPSGWYANPDEQDRLPTPGSGGLTFAGNDLIHHATTGTVEHLTHGTYTASPGPDQPSFFSVEVYGSDGGYATLRWDTTTSKWTMVTGGQLYTNTDPAALVDMPAVHKSHHVISFGVGYTANPPGTVTTVVSTVTFDGTTYDLKCKPAPSSSSASPSTSASTSASPSVSASASSSAAGAPATTTGAGGAGGLAITGPRAGVLAAVAGVGLAAGLLLLLLVRRRRTSFTA